MRPPFDTDFSPAYMHVPQPVPFVPKMPQMTPSTGVSVAPAPPHPGVEPIQACWLDEALRQCEQRMQAYSPPRSPTPPRSPSPTPPTAALPMTSEIFLLCCGGTRKFEPEVQAMPNIQTMSVGTISMPFMPPAAMYATPVPPTPTDSSSRTPLRTFASPYVSARDRAASAPEDDTPSDFPQTSLLIRNLPDGFTRSMLMDVLGAHGLAVCVDFLYVPGDLKNKTHYGYAFLNFTTPDAADDCLVKLNGFRDWGVPSECICETSRRTNRQGLDAHVEWYRNSRIMHASVDDEYKPAVFRNGSRVPFPPPTKSFRAPRLRKASF